MIRKTRTAAIAASLTAALALAACSSGGKQGTDSAANPGKANTPKMTVAMVTHQAPGDTF
jgi:simple sugar transport system substrate-binding protein